MPESKDPENVAGSYAASRHFLEDVFSGFQFPLLCGGFTGCSGGNLLSLALRSLGAESLGGVLYRRSARFHARILPYPGDRQPVTDNSNFTTTEERPRLTVCPSFVKINP